MGSRREFTSSRIFLAKIAGKRQRISEWVTWDQSGTSGLRKASWIQTVLMSRIYSRTALESMSWCHSFTHMTSVENVRGILACGVAPRDRTVYMSPFPPHHPHHTVGSRSRAPVLVSSKKEALFLLRDLWASSCSSVLCTEHIPRELILSAWLQPRPRWSRQEDLRTL